MEKKREYKEDKRKDWVRSRKGYTGNERAGEQKITEISERKNGIWVVPI